MAMRLMGEQFVTGETIAEALANARKLEEKGFRKLEEKGFHWKRKVSVTLTICWAKPH